MDASDFWADGPADWEGDLPPWMAVRETKRPPPASTFQGRCTSITSVELWCKLPTLRVGTIVRADHTYRRASRARSRPLG